MRLAQLAMISGAMLESLMSASDCVEKMTLTFFFLSVLSHCRIRAANTGSSRNSHASSRISSRSEEHTSELQSLMRISYAVFCLKKKNEKQKIQRNANSRNLLQRITKPTLELIEQL